MSIVSFEYEILVTEYMYLFENIEMNRHIERLKEISEQKGKANLFIETRYSDLFKEYYDKVESKAKTELLKEYGEIDERLLRHKITFEKMCKYLLSDALRNELYIYDKFGKCWEEDCCIKRKNNTRQCNLIGNIILTSDEKKLHILQKSRYGKLIELLHNLLGEEHQLGEINIKDKIGLSVDTQMLEAHYVQKVLRQEARAKRAEEIKKNKEKQSKSTGK